VIKQMKVSPEHVSNMSIVIADTDDFWGRNVAGTAANWAAPLAAREPKLTGSPTTV
jgi:hypothetical protein